MAQTSTTYWLTADESGKNTSQILEQWTVRLSEMVEYVKNTLKLNTVPSHRESYSILEQICNIHTCTAAANHMPVQS